jgi:hypothetical protein
MKNGEKRWGKALYKYSNGKEGEKVKNEKWRKSAEARRYINILMEGGDMKR